VVRGSAGHLLLDADAGPAVGRAHLLYPPEKASALLDLKKRLGLPDARHDMKECQLCDMPDMPGAIAMAPSSCAALNATASSEDVEAIVKGVTDAVMAALGQRK